MTLLMLILFAGVACLVILLAMLIRSLLRGSQCDQSVDSRECDRRMRAIFDRLNHLSARIESLEHTLFARINPPE